MKSTKSGLRDTFRRLRLSIPALERATRSRAIAENILALPQVAGAPVLMAYVAVGSEVDTRPILEACWLRGRAVALPRLVDAAGGVMEMRLVRQAADLVAGPQNIPEPDVLTCPLHMPQTGDVVLVPGVAFTPAGLRLGQGGGYYDRFLAAHPACWSIGLAFAEQMAGALPQEPHDGRLSQVVSG